MRAVEVRGWDPIQKQEFLATVKVHAEVQSGEDLENFARGILITDENVESLVSDESSVEVRYSLPVRFLGFLETSIPARITVMDADGDGAADSRVKVRFPWYRVLFSIPEEVSASSLESELSAKLGAELVFSEDIGFSPSRAAQLYQSIAVALKVKHDVAMNSIRNIK